MSDSIDVHSHPWYNRGHHVDGGGFSNPSPPYLETSVAKGTLWFLSTLFDRKENRPPPAHSVDPDKLGRSPSGVSLTWIGHSTLLVRTPGATVLFDPIFSSRASPVSFAGPVREAVLPMELSELPPIDIVILSHDHYDHLDHATIKALIERHDPLFLVPLGVARYVRKWGGTHVAEMDWWQYADVDGGTRYHCVPAKHFSGRSHFNRDETLWAAWYVEHRDGGTRLFYGGDTGYAPHFKQIRDHLGVPHIAILPIGAYLPPWLMQPVHMNPEEALSAFHDLGASHMIPVHWGTFDMAEEPIHAPADTLRHLIAARSLEKRVHLLDIGETWHFEADPQATK